MKSKKILVVTCATLLCLIFGTSYASERKLKKSELPAAVQKAADEQSKGATVVGYSTEKDNGQTVYEVQLKVNEHNKDITMDAAGRVLEIEEEVAFNSLSQEVKTGLTTAAGKGKLGTVESLTKGGKLVAYEAKVITNGKKSEVQVGPKGEKLAHEE